MSNIFKSVGGWIVGILVLVLMFGAWGLCQYGYGQARPYIPGPVRTLIGSENEFEADNYLRSVPRQFERFFEQSEKCREENDQACQTKAVEDLKDTFGDSVPASASWISGSHGRVYRALEEMAVVNKLSETQNNAVLIRRIFAAQDELIAAADEWYEQATR